MKSYCIAVPKKKGEEVRVALLEGGLLRKDRSIARNKNFIYFPINDVGEDSILGYEVLEREFEILERRVKSYKDVVNVANELRKLLPTSFDMIGKIALVKLSDEILDYKKEIGIAILQANKSIDTVALDLGVEGEERIRRLEILAGKKTTETLHKEYGIELEIDPFKIYFSPRLATEHWRIAQMVEEGEVIIDMFCGVGPFSILISNYCKPKLIYAIDINEEAVFYLERNIKRNKVSNIKPILGDSKAIVPKLESADRIIMNLPFSSYEFLSTAFSNVKNNGIIHYYEVLTDKKKERRFEDLIKIGEESDVIIKKLSDKAVHTYSPDSSLFCFDLKVERR